MYWYSSGSTTQVSGSVLVLLRELMIIGSEMALFITESQWLAASVCNYDTTVLFITCFIKLKSIYVKYDGH